MTAERHPRGLYVLFATEMWERFGFYTLIAMLTLYLQDTKEGFGWSKADATGLYANYLMFVYASPLIGGFLADRYLGFRRSIVLGAIFFTAGYALLSVGSVAALYGSLTLLVIGNGFFKPNISSMVGQLYPPGSNLKDAAYNIFYMGINIGALTAPLVAEGMRQRFGFHPAFLVASAGMGLGLVIFALCQRYVVEVSKAPVVEETDMTDTPAPPKHVSALEAVPEGRRIGALLVIFAIVIVFWMIFHQNGSTLTYWANDNTDWASSKVLPVIIKIMTLGFVSGEDVSGVISNSINPFWIVVLSYPLVMFWNWLGKRGLEPSTPAKMAIGMTLTGISFLTLYAAAISGGDTGKVSPWWLICSYFIISLGELMLSPMGLSLVSKVAPERMRGLMMGGWFVATAIGNKLTMIGVYWTVWSHSRFFLTLAVMALVMAFVLLILLRPLKRAMPGV